MFRYVIVGGISAVVDIAGLTFFVEVIFNSEKTPVNMAVATAAGFILGLMCNYVLSMMFVFTNDSQKEQNKKKTQKNLHNSHDKTFNKKEKSRLCNNAHAT